MRQPAATTAAQRLFARHRDTVEGYLFIAPFLGVYLVFLIFPFLKGIWISLHEWDLLAVAFNPAAKILVGLENYVDTLWASKMSWGPAAAWPLQALALAGVALVWWAAARGGMTRRRAGWIVAGLALLILALGIGPGDGGRWHDRRFWPIVGNTLVFVLFTVPLVTAISLLLAVVLNRQTRMMAGFRTAFFISQVLSVTVVTLIWQMVFSPRQGLFANVVRSVGLEPGSWLTHETLAMAAIVITTVWWSIGFAMVMFLAGLQEIPRDRYEAARLDGAGPWNLFRHITLPGIRRTTTLVIVFEIILHFQVFGQSHLITQGGPNDRTQVLVRYIYQTAFRDSDLGHASALAVMLFLAMLGFSFLQLRLNREPD